MTAPAGVPGLSRRLAVLFLLALGGVLVAVGLVVADLGGLPALLGYVAVAVAVVVAGIARGRRMAAQAARAASRQGGHCSCCDGDHTAPVKVI